MEIINNSNTDLYDFEKVGSDSIYDGTDLGITYTPKQTSFKVWAPLAERMELIIYHTGDITNNELGLVYPMEASYKGTWSTILKGDYENLFYTYRVKNPDTEELETGDPYAIAVGINGDRSAIVDLSKTNPENWSQDINPTIGSMTDEIIYELHIRDLSTHSASGIKNIGKFLQFTENPPNSKDSITRGINHIKELGITAVHLLPVFDYSTIDEKKLEENNFNWGYDPKNYNVPEGSYSTDPYAPNVRILEFKQMVMALHKNGIRVIMDVVYNHTVDNTTSKFHILVPGYYYRMNSDGTFCDGSYCGSETASERAMVRKYIVDSVKYWATEYHIDGFRFDLMGLHDVDTMNLVRSELSEISSNIHIYGEGWDMGNLPSQMRAIQAAANRMPGIGMFNDNFRDNLKGPYDDVTGHGFIDGKQEVELEIMKCVTGSIEYSSIIKDYNSTPDQSINYVEAHDNNTLWDKLNLGNPNLPEETLIKMDLLAASILLTSQGVPFIAAGQEFLRTKYGDENSFKSPDYVNMLDWERKTTYIKVFNYYKGLITLRRYSSAFRLNSLEAIKKSIFFIAAPKNVIAYIIKNSDEREHWKNILVAYNANTTSMTIDVPMGNWTIVVKDLISGIEAIETNNSSTLVISPISSIVMHTNDEIEFDDLILNI